MRLLIAKLVSFYEKYTSYTVTMIRLYLTKLQTNTFEYLDDVFLYCF